MRRLLAALVLLPTLVFAEGPPPTLLQMAGAHPTPAHLSESVLLVIDAQREYVGGALPLVGVGRALAEGGQLLARARAAGTPIVHVVHRGHGGLFNPEGPSFRIAAPFTPKAGETVVTKILPNAFAGTTLGEVLARTGRKRLIVVGFMTHMCVSSTVRAALDQGYVTTVVASATATRDLPDGHGGAISAAVVQETSLAALADRFATVVRGQADIAE